MRLQDLVRHKPESLESLTWDELLTIIERIVPNSGGKVLDAVNETLDIIENCIEHVQFSGSVEKFYSVIDTCVRTRGVSYKSPPQSQFIRVRSETNDVVF